MENGVGCGGDVVHAAGHDMLVGAASHETAEERYNVAHLGQCGINHRGETRLKG